jgi:hypothetical protein
MKLLDTKTCQLISGSNQGHNFDFKITLNSPSGNALQIATILEEVVFWGESSSTLAQTLTQANLNSFTVERIQFSNFTADVSLRTLLLHWIGLD